MQTEIVKHFSDGLVASQLNVVIILGSWVEVLAVILTFSTSLSFPRACCFHSCIGVNVVLEMITKIIYQV
jgi:hypothetical protein